MKETAIFLLGSMAAALSTVSLLPQVIRTWRTGSAGDISMLWLVVALIAMAMWIGYGGLLDAPAIVLANALTFVQAGLILFVKLRSERRLRTNRPR